MINDPLWVAHPSFNDSRLVNVEAMLQMLTTFDAKETDPIATGALLTIARTIRTLNVTVHDPEVTNPVYLTNLYRDLHRLEDALGSLIEQQLQQAT